MLPTAHHPLSPPLSPTSSSATSLLLAPPPGESGSPARPLFPPDDDDGTSSVSPSPSRNSLRGSLASTENDDISYFAPRRPSPRQKDDLFLRPALASHLTLRPASLSASLSASTQHSPSPETRDNEPLPEELLPKSLAFPQAPHLLSTDSPLLVSLPPAQLLALVKALSRDLAKSVEENQRGERECEALVGMLKDKAVGDGEVKRARVRARADPGEGSKKEWRIELREKAPIGEGEAETDTDAGVRAEVRRPLPVFETKDLPDADWYQSAISPQAVLDLDDLAEAISENAFSFSADEHEHDHDHEPSPHHTMADELISDTDSVSRLSVSSSHNDTPIAPRLPSLTAVATARTRQRHASLSSRIFSTFSLGGTTPPITTPPIPSSSSFSSLTVPPGAVAATLPRRHRRSDSLRSVSSVASASGASEAGSIVERKLGGGNYGEWIGWRGWSSSKARDDAAGKRSVLSPASVEDEDEEQDEVGEEEGETDEGHADDEQTARSTLGLTFGRPRRRGSTASDESGSRPVGEATSIAHSTMSSSVLSARSHATTAHSSLTTSDPPSSPTTSTSPPSSSAPDSNARPLPAQPPASPAHSPLLSRSRGPSIPLLTSQHSVVSSASLSTPTPTSTLSSPSRSHLTRNLSNSRKSSRTVRGADSDIVLPQPTHFTAVAEAATRWLSSATSQTPPAHLVNASVGERVKSLVDALLGGVAAAGLLQVLPLDAAAAAVQEAAEDDEEDDPDRTLRQSSAPQFLSIPVPLYLASNSPPRPPKEKGYVSSAKGTIGRALGLGASASHYSSLGMARSASDGVRRVLAAAPAGEQQPNVTMFPKLSALSRYSPFAQPALSTPSTHVSLSSHSAVSIPPSPSMPSVTSFAPTTMELDTISGEATPPTLHNPSPSRANQAATADGPMVDRYGFLYDVRSGMKLLREERKRAARGGVSEVLDEDQLREAAALVEEASAREEEEEREQSQVELNAELEALREALGLPATSPTVGRAPKLSNGPSSASVSTRSSDSSRPPRPSRLVRSQSMDTSPTPPGGPQSMKRLLNQLTEMHDAVEKTQKEAWESFIDRRQAKLRAATNEGGPLRRDRPRQNGGLNLLVNNEATASVPGEDAVDLGWTANLVGVAQMGLAGKSGKEDWNEFKLLVRKGVPLVFRPK